MTLSIFTLETIWGHKELKNVAERYAYHMQRSFLCQLQFIFL